MRISDWSSDVCSSDLLVEGHLLLAFSAGEVDGHLISLHFRTGQTSAQQNLQTLHGKNLERFLGDLLIGSWQDLFHSFDNGHFRAEARPEFGRATCRERVWQYVSISVGDGSRKK